MSSTTNTTINSRSMNGVITITDGTATLEDGNLNCNDINSDSINTASITTGILLVMVNFVQICWVHTQFQFPYRQ